MLEMRREFILYIFEAPLNDILTISFQLAMKKFQFHVFIVTSHLNF